MVMQVEIYRYNPESDSEPRMQELDFDLEGRDMMILDVLEALKVRDSTITYRRSCREGVCGSDGMNINGKNMLACVSPVSKVIKNNRLVIRPMPGLPVIRDLVVDMAMFWEQYEKVEPYLQNNEPTPTIERLQSPEERARLDGYTECIMCGCCSTACPSWWWNPSKYLGPAALLQLWRFVDDSRDTSTKERLEKFDDPFSIFRCRSILACDFSCPKGLTPHTAIGNLKRKMVTGA
jgi:succinate dehydrogenase / fumarate reductase iron-sulfur subunit